MDGMLPLNRPQNGLGVYYPNERSRLMSVCLTPAISATLRFTAFPRNVNAAFWRPPVSCMAEEHAPQPAISSSMVMKVSLRAIAAVRGTALPTL